MEISAVIPTRNRMKDLSECLNSILSQSLLPGEVIIVDDGSLDDEFLEEYREKLGSAGVGFLYLKKRSPGLAASRNLAAGKASGEFILILDDDVVLGKGFIRALYEICLENKEEKEFGGAGGVVSNYRRRHPLERFYRRLFRITSYHSWDITSAGFQVWDDSLKERETAYYLHGGLSMYRRDLLLESPFRNLSPGRTSGGDPDFFMRAKNKGYRFIIEPGAKAVHKLSPLSRDRQYARGVKEGHNQYIIFRDNADRTFENWALFIWSNTGWVLRQIPAGRPVRAAGMVTGLVKAAFLEGKKLIRN